MNFKKYFNRSIVTKFFLKNNNLNLIIRKKRTGVIIAGLLIFALIVRIISAPLAEAATFYFSQTSWLGGSSANTASHTNDQSGWTKYLSKDDNFVAGADLHLGTTGNTFTQNNDGTTSTGFNLTGANFSNTSVVGTGTSAVISNSIVNSVTPMVAAGTNFGLALKSNGIVWSWGFNSQGQLGDGTTTQRANPVQVVDASDGTGFLTGVVQIATGAMISGAASSYALKSDGTVKAWGYNGQAQLGNGSTSQSNSPTSVSGLTGVTQIASGSTSVFARKSDGTVWAWGANNQSQLSDGTTTQRASPVQVIDPSDQTGFLTNVIALASSGQGSNFTTTYALKSNGTVVSWGYNGQGQIGDGTTVPRTTPVLVSGLSNVTNIAAGTTSGYARKSDGTVWAWGGNNQYQLADGTTTNRSSPAQISGLTSVIDISASLQSAYALKSDGTVMAWGNNGQAQLGNNSTSPGTAPVQVQDAADQTTFLTNIIAIGSGSNFAFAIKPTGALMAWGYNTVNQLGDGTTTQRKTAINVLNTPGGSNFNVGYSSYYTSGTYTSGVIDLTVQPASFSTLSYTAIKPTNTNIVVDARAGDSSSVDGTWTSWQTGISTGGDISSLGSHRYVQYKATLTTSDDTVTPSLEDVTFGYNSYPTEQSLISSAYNTTDSGNVIGGVSFDEDATLPAGTGVVFSLRTASSEAGLTSATWYPFTNATTDCGKVDTTVTCTSDSIPGSLKTGNNDKWWQYKITLTSGGQNTPTVTSAEVTYVVNAAPVFESVTASQDSTGIVNITYSVKDPDTTTGSVTPGEITPSFEYWNGTAWVATTTLSANATAIKDVEADSYTEYQLTWNPKIDFNSRYLTSAQIRVTANDNEAANNTTTALSDTFTLDTKNPVIDTFVLDARDDVVNNIAITITEDSLDNLKMKISNNSDLSADGLNVSSGDWIDYSSASAWTFSEVNPIVYYQLKDKYGNISNSGGISSVNLPPTPLSVDNQDVSVVDTSEWREFISWGRVTIASLGFKQYNIYRSSDGTNYSLLSVKTSNAENFILDSDLDTNIVYYYKVTAEDNAGNVSAYSNIVSDRPDGQEGDSTIPPVISNVAISDIAVQSALITWDTDIPADSRVYYITNDSGDFSSAPSVGVATILDNSSNLGQHSVSLSGLTTGVTYYIQVASAGPNTSTTTGGDGMYFTTSSGPVISNVRSSDVQNTTADILWTTSEASDTRVFYSTNSTLTNPVEVAISNSTVSHTISLTGLSINTKYYYYVTSGVTSDKNIFQGEILYYNFTTTSDIVPPVITFDPETGITEIAETSVRISWSTNELASSAVEYSVNPSFGYDTVNSNDNLNTNHSFLLTGLTKGTLYNFRIKSTDINENEETLTSLTFLTIDLSDETPPEITNARVEQVYDTTAIISWSTDEAANSTVDYGTQSEVYTLAESNALYNYSHSIILTGLTVSTTYYFKVTSADGSGNSSTDDEISFTTLSLLRTGGGSSANHGTNQDTEVPIISNVNVVNLTDKTAKITWKTNELADSAVEFGETEDFELASITRSARLEHSQNLTNLFPSTLYNFRITSADVFGNLSSEYLGTFTTLAFVDSAELEQLIENQDSTDTKFINRLKSLLEDLRNSSKKVSPSVLEKSLLEQKNSIQELANTAPLPKLISPPIIQTWEDLAIVSWETDKKTNSLMAYSEKVFGPNEQENIQVVGNPDIYSAKHQVVLPGLKASTKYYYQLRGKNEIGSQLDFIPDIFTTLSKTAKIENYVVDRLSDSSVSFKWSSSLPTNTAVRVTPYRNNALSQDESKVSNDPNKTLIHQMTIKDLEPGVFYKVDLYGDDETGKTLSQSIEAFSTSNNELPFIINQIKTSSAISVSGNLKVQSIISWDTTKLSTSKVYYRKGTSKDDNNWPSESTTDPSYTRNHLVVMVDFDPGQVYQFQVESADSNGQKIRSKTHTILTPRQKESVFQVILKNVEQTFGWVGGVRK